VSTTKRPKKQAPPPQVPEAADVQLAAKLGKLLNADKGKHRCEPRGSCSLVIFRGVSLSTAMAARLVAILEKAS